MATNPAPIVKTSAPNVGIRRPAPPKPTARRDFFVYGINFAALLANTTSQGSIQIQADATFELQKLSFFADVALAAQEQSTRVLPLVTLQLFDSGNGRQVFSTDIPIPAIMGDGQIPFILPTTKTFAPNSSVVVSVSNYSAGTDYNLRLALIGTKVFHYG